MTQGQPVATRPDQATRQLSKAVKVTQVLYSGLGGHASVAFSLLGGDHEQQWDSSLLFIGIEPLAPAYRRQTDKLGLPFISIQSRQGKSWRSWGTVYASLRRLNPEVIILHSISSLLPVALYCLMHGAEMIAVAHTSISLRSHSEKIMSALALLLARRMVVLTDAYKSAFLAAAKMFKRSHKVVVIPNGIDVTAFSRFKLRSEDGTFRIGMAARFSSTKRQDLLVLALAQQLPSHPNVRWQLTLAGDGDCLEAVRALVDSNGKREMVDFMGHLDEPRLIEWFRSLDLYAHASEGEALSTSMLQAMSMGLPILASPVPGISGLLDNEGRQLGLLTAENTPEAFADGIVHIQSDPELQARLGDAGKARVLSSYSQEQMFKSYNNLIQECLI